MHCQDQSLLSISIRDPHGKILYFVLRFADAYRTRGYGMSKIFFLLTLLFSLFLNAAENSVIKAPFSGSDYKHLTKNSSILEIWGDVDASGSLIDHSGENLFAYSEDFTQAGTWATSNATLTGNAYQNPFNGLLTADALNEGAAAATTHYISQSVSVTSGRIYTLSLYVTSIQQTDPAKTRGWIALGPNAGASMAYFNLDTCTVGTTSTVISTSAKAVYPDWCKVAVRFAATSTASVAQRIYVAETDNDVTFDGGTQVAYGIFGAQFVDNTDNVIADMGRYVATGAASKPRLDLSPTNAPTLHTSRLQTSDNRFWQGRTFNGTTQYYSKLHHDAMNIFDGDFTITVVLKQPTTAAATDHVFSHGSAGVNGCTLYNAVTYSALQLDNSGLSPASRTAAVSATWNDDKYHVLQGVRRGNISFVSADGNRSSGKDVTNYGVDGSNIVYLSGSSPLEGSILYFRLDASALTDTELETDRQLLMGYGMGQPKQTNVGFSRASAGYVTLFDNTLAQRMAGLPRVGRDGLLIEGTATNLQRYSQAFNSWAVLSDLTVPTTNAASPDPNSNTACVLHESGVGSIAHFIQDTNSSGLTAGAVHTYSVRLKPINRNWVLLRAKDPASPTRTCYFNISTGKVGTALNCTGRIEPKADGYYKCSITFTQTVGQTTSEQFIYIAEADGDITFDAGAGQDSLYVWGSQLELGSHPTTYIPTTTGSATRLADNLTMRPWKLTPNVRTGTETWWTTFDQDVASTGTVVLGGKTFTQAGDTKHVQTSDLSNYYDFDGTGDYLSIADNTFDQTGSFSLVFAVTPSNLTGNHYICSKGTTPGEKRWYIYLSSDSVILSLSSDGTTVVSLTKATACSIGKTSIVTTAYDNITHTGSIWVDDLAVASRSDFTGVIADPAKNFSIGSGDGGGSPFAGKFHFLGIHTGTALTQTQHDTAFNNMKESAITPLVLSNIAPATYTSIEFDAKCEWNSSTDIGVARTFLELSGNTGLAGSAKLAATNRNRLILSTNASATLTTSLADSTATAHSIGSAISNSTTYGSWHHYKIYWSCADLSGTYLEVDGLTTGYTTATAMTGTCTLNNHNTTLRLGSIFDDTLLNSPDCSFKNFRIRYGQ
jgi:hypothetical protein